MIQLILGHYLIGMGMKGMGINLIIVHFLNLVLILIYCHQKGYLKMNLIVSKDEVLYEIKEYTHYVL